MPPKTSKSSMSSDAMDISDPPGAPAPLPAAETTLPPVQQKLLNATAVLYGTLTYKTSSNKNNIVVLDAVSNQIFNVTCYVANTSLTIPRDELIAKNVKTVFIAKPLMSTPDNQWSFDIVDIPEYRIKSPAASVVIGQVRVNRPLPGDCVDNRVLSASFAMPSKDDNGKYAADAVSITTVFSSPDTFAKSRMANTIDKELLKPNMLGQPLALAGFYVRQVPQADRARQFHRAFDLGPMDAIPLWAPASGMFVANLSAADALPADQNGADDDRDSFVLSADAVKSTPTKRRK